MSPRMFDNRAVSPQGDQAPLFNEDGTGASQARTQIEKQVVGTVGVSG
jgi:hypothetical protein